MSTSQQQYHSQALNLTDVPETMLWTLHNLASAATHKDGCLQDTSLRKVENSQHN